MIQEFVDRFIASRDTLKDKWRTKLPDSYDDIVKQVIEVVRGNDPDYHWRKPDPECIHVIDDGDYQGTRLYIIAANGYQPSTYWYVKIGYGSCSACDTFQGIRYEDEGEQQIESFYTLALHVVQGLKVME